MLRKFSVLEMLHKRWFSVKPLVQMDEVVNKKLEDEEIKPRKHPGILKSKSVQIPDWVAKGMLKVSADHPLKTLLQDGEQLAAYLNQRHPPPDETEIQSKLVEVKEIISKKIDPKKLSHEEMAEFWQRNSVNVKLALKQRVYSWTALQYDAYKSLVYMMARGAQDYAVLHKIFNEISVYDKNFMPKNLFDFGSGIGTVVWAASQFWKKSLGEYYCVDSSPDMNNLADTLIGNYSSSIKHVYFRQFLPASARIKSDIVVCAYSLFEMPSAQARLNLILNLWLKTEKYLVIVEQGTNAGFKIVNEARDFILDISTKSLETENPNPCHIFAPCPHDLICPRYVTDHTPCNFEVPYCNLPFNKRSEVKQERYSYVVLRRGERADDDQQWPRIVRPTLVRSKHTICRMCTAAGKLEEVIFTAAKHGKLTYRCARHSNWGDKLPIRLVDRPKSEDPE